MVVGADRYVSGLLAENRLGATVHILDDGFQHFGLARDIDSKQGTMQSGRRAGTPAYMAPELFRGEKATIASDVYALGLLLFELFTGAPPHASLDREQLQKLRQVPPPALADFAPEIDPALDRVVAECLDPNPVNRPASASAVAAALPGGDQLAAAVAMGETPSPDLVAAAEPAQTMRARSAAAAGIEDVV